MMFSSYQGSPLYPFLCYTEHFSPSFSPFPLTSLFPCASPQFHVMVHPGVGGFPCFLVHLGVGGFPTFPAFPKIYPLSKQITFFNLKLRRILLRIIIRKIILVLIQAITKDNQNLFKSD